MKKKKVKLQEQLARAVADYQNLVKRIEKQEEEQRARAAKRIIEAFLPVLDNLEIAQKHLNDEGIRAAIWQFQKVLATEGVEKISPEKGEKFDESLHEVLDIKEGEEKGTVAEVVKTGYKWKDGAVLRPARVVVYKGDELISDK